MILNLVIRTAPSRDISPADHAEIVTSSLRAWLSARYPGTDLVGVSWDVS